MPVHESMLLSAALQAGLTDPATVSRLRPLARAQRISLLESLARELRLPPAAFWQALAQQRALPWLDLAGLQADEALLRRLPAVLLQKHAMVPVRDAQGQGWLAVSDPDDRIGPQTVQRLLGIELRSGLAEPDALSALLQRETGRPAQSTGSPRAAEEDATQLLDRLMKDSLLRRATDIHVEAGEPGHALRLRVDGVLQPWGLPLARTLGEALVSRIKVLAGMDISESRAPQDGGMKFAIAQWDGDAVDVRVASMPTRHGERLTLRLLGSTSQGGNVLGLDQLGMPPDVLEPLRERLARPHGIVLVTGPTGSGKSTTLYAALRELDHQRLNILTIEDPVEQEMAGISQVGVSAKMGFAEALRSFLRHDPDIILVGEVRDADTADTALKAAATGHLVLSSLHTNSAAGAVSRLVNIGCERYMIADTLAGVIAQRLVRRLCGHCALSRPLAAAERALLGDAPWPADAVQRVPVGCPHCLGTGYRGRLGLYEGLWLDADLAAAVARGAGERELSRLARQRQRLYALADDARAKVLAGLTSLAEARAYLHRDEAPSSP
jgi:type II secretory ATPase GspE/PulE/Tfp pilus assembly ATPase PilB-like protein